MHQLAVVSTSSQWPPHWKLEGFQLHHHTALSQLDGDVRFDCILLVEPPPESLNEVLQALKERDRQGTVATLVAGAAQSAGMQALLRHYPCDGFLDLSWPEPLASAGLRMAGSRGAGPEHGGDPAGGDRPGPAADVLPV